ncbi:MAG: ABC transporter transmembrane domain-containing protein [Pseudomonadota bacterium]
MSETTETASRQRPRPLGALRALVPFVLPYRLTLLAAFGALIAASAALLSLPRAVRHLVDSGFAQATSDSINGLFLGAFAVAAAYGVFAALRYYLVIRLGERVVADVRKAVFDKVIRLDPVFFESTRVGEVQSRLTSDTTLIESVSGAGISIVLRSTLNLVAGLTLLALTSLRLAGLTLLLFPAVLIPLMVLGRRVRSRSRETQDRVADTSALAGESLNAIQTVQAFTLESLLGGRYSEAVEAGYRAALGRIRVRALLMMSVVLVVFGAIIAVLWIGARDVLDGTMSAGELGQFLLYAMIVAGSAAALSETWGEVQRAAGAMERLSELLAATPQVVAPPMGSLSLPPEAQGRLRFDAVSFSYPSRPQQRALSEFSLAVDAGEHVAFVGASGAGKSTTFQLLLRFYDPTSGRVLVDGTDIVKVSPSAVRERFGLVPQDTVVFGTSALENIRLGRPSASDAEVRAAAEAAAADSFIRELPEGYDTYLGERGTRLSGGQRQRIAIARALLRDPPILLLDEATSALDAHSERLVQDAFTHLMTERTTLVIAHRLATVLRCDRIVFMAHGQIVDIGTHAQLVARNEGYARLAALQFADAQAAAID